MSRERALIFTVLLTGCALGVLFLLLSGERAGNHPALAKGLVVSKRGSEIAQTSAYTVYLPLVVRYYDPGYASPFGIVMYGSVDDVAGLQEMEDAGSKWVTTMLHWSAIEPSKGNYNWSSFDTKAQNAQAAGMDVFVLFTSNPSWAASLPGGPVTDTQDLVDFVTLMAERYDCDGVDDASGSPCVHYWSFYAEPDNGDIGRAQTGKGYWE
ncbi:MAG: beta-galactosidase, partial [Chloroflexota bacterium]|nr:beta-galactosidase [Chloroflexota bacterium]